MRVFVYESLTAGSLDDRQDALPEPSLLREGAAMLAALVADLAIVKGVQVTVLVDERAASDLPLLLGPNIQIVNRSSRAAQFDRLAASSEATVVIAPEIGGELVRVCRRAKHVGGTLIAPHVETVELLSDKHRTAEHVQASGVATTSGVRLEPGRLHLGQIACVRFPAVLKPLNGAGSLGVRLVRSPDEIEPSEQARRLESFVAGIAASVAALCGPNGNTLLPACTQRLSSDGLFTYLGGSAPLAGELAERAEQLAAAALATVGGLAGYVGVDLILGEDATGRDDVVVEINPRLTTSYVGLRRLAESNLAESNLAAAMLVIARGRPSGPLRFRPGRVEFDADGAVRYISPAADAKV